MIYMYAWIGLCFLLIIVTLIGNAKESKEKKAESKRQFIKDNLTAINSHRRKSSSSWARTGLLFKNK